MFSPQDHDRLQAYLAGELLPPDAADLEAQLKSDAQLAEALLMAAREEAICADWARVAGQTSRIKHTNPTNFDGASRRTLRLPSSLRRRWATVAALATAAVVLLWIRSSFVRHESAPAQLEQIAGRVFILSGGERRPAEAGQPVLAGQGLEMSGDDAWAVITYADGTRLEFDGDTTVTEFTGGGATSKRVVLAAGNVRADVSKQAPGLPMILKTANAEVVVLGTKFDLSGSTAATYVETSEGLVRLVRGDGRSVEVPAGFESRADGDAELNVQPSPPRYHRSRFTTPGNHHTTLLSPDGKILVTSRFGAGTVTLWDTNDGRERLALSADARQVEATAVSADGMRLATAGVERRIVIWNPATGERLQTLDAPERLQALSFSADGATLFALAGVPQNSLDLHAWDWAADRPRGEPQSLRCEAWSFSSSGRSLAVSSARDDTVTVWDLAAGRERTVFRNLTSRTICLAVSHDDLQVAVSDKSGRVAVYDVDAAREGRTFFPPGGSVQGLAFSPDGTELAMGLRFATVRVWSLVTGKQCFILEGDRRPGSTASVRPMSFTPDQKTLVTTESQDDSVVRLWDLPAK